MSSPPALCFPLCIYPPSCTLHSSHSPAARPHQPCLRKPQWAEAGCSHSDWQAGARGGSHHHTRTGSHTCIPCPGKGSPAGSGTGSSGLSSENRGARLRCGPSPHASTQPPHKNQALLLVTLGWGPKDESDLGLAFKGSQAPSPGRSELRQQEGQKLKEEITVSSLERTPEIRLNTAYYSDGETGVQREEPHPSGHTELPIYS